jgi:hypothetical protein
MNIALLLFAALLGFAAGILITGVVDEERMEELELVTPESYDILLRDLPIKTMKIKTKEVFNFVYNSNFDGAGSYPISGVILDDTFLRVVIPVVVRFKKRAIQTSCVLITGAPFTFFSLETFNAVGIEYVNSYARVAVQGLPIAVYESRGHFVDINVCGQSFMSLNHLRMTINYRTRKVILEETLKLTSEEIDEL